MKLTRKEVLNVAKLARLSLSEEQVKRFQNQLSDILDNFSILSEINTQGVIPTAQPFDIQNVVEQDIVQSSLNYTEILLNAPDSQGKNFKVHVVLE